jgi:hypothetical protein
VSGKSQRQEIILREAIAKGNAKITEEVANLQRDLARRNMDSKGSNDHALRRHP